MPRESIHRTPKRAPVEEVHRGEDQEIVSLTFAMR
jgi:hypothetical protein